MPHAPSPKGKDRAWVVPVTMGYGHLRAAYPLRDLARDHYLYADDYKGMPASDRKVWHQGRGFYETVSRFRTVPIIGQLAFKLLDEWQQIPPFYPRRDLSKPIFQVRELYGLFKRGFMRHFVDHISKDSSLPLITSFFIPAQAADYFGFKNDIYCIVCDTDISRIWVPLEPKKSKIKFIAPNRRIVERLKQYGVPEKNIFLTGFPLPKKLIGDTHYGTVKRNLSSRLLNLDPSGIYRSYMAPALEQLLDGDYTNAKKTHPLSIVFAVGGAGAQREMALPILQSLKRRIKNGELRITLVAGNRPEVAQYFNEGIRASGLRGERGVSILLGKDKEDYFKKFEKLLPTTDVLWTKPSELSFYVALGIPIIIAPTIGSQEDSNSWWLRNIGAGIPQLDPKHADEWLFDWLDSGWLARAAVQGFTNAPTRGIFRIEQLAEKRTVILPDPIEPV